MTKIRLEINSIEIERIKKRWNLYFIFATENPENPGETAITVIPQSNLIKIRKPSDNLVIFEPHGENTEGLFIMEREMPNDYSVKARLWVMHSHKELRTAGEILDDLGGLLGGTTAKTIINALGNTNIWITIGTAAIGIVGKVMKAIKDRNLGFVGMDEHFNPEGEEDEEVERINSLSTGFAQINWSWIIMD